MLFWCRLALFGDRAVLEPQSKSRALPYVAGARDDSRASGDDGVHANPYARLDWIPPDGAAESAAAGSGDGVPSANLYLGYVAASIPFAFAIAALVTRRLDAEWLLAVRRWSLVSWLFLTIGITLGMWWAYVELGWGGYWAWIRSRTRRFSHGSPGRHSCTPS